MSKLSLSSNAIVEAKIECLKIAANNPHTQYDQVSEARKMFEFIIEEVTSEPKPTQP